MIGFYIVNEMIEMIVGSVYLVLVFVGVLYLGKAIRAARS